jgi:hypothetical protein
MVADAKNAVVLPIELNKTSSLESVCIKIYIPKIDASTARIMTLRCIYENPLTVQVLHLEFTHDQNVC